MIGSFTSIKKQLKKREMSREIECWMIDNQYDVTTISSIDGYILFYQNDSFNIALFNWEYLPKCLDTKKSFFELFPGTV